MGIVHNDLQNLLLNLTVHEHLGKWAFLRFCISWIRKSGNQKGDHTLVSSTQTDPKIDIHCVGCPCPVTFQYHISLCSFMEIPISQREQVEWSGVSARARARACVCVHIHTSVYKRDTEMNKYYRSREAMERDLKFGSISVSFRSVVKWKFTRRSRKVMRLCKVGHGR
jgi:hypothetical protein